MSDYLMRDAAPFGDEGWEKIDEMVVGVINRYLVGRRFVSMVGPLGWGVDYAPTFRFDKTVDGADVAEATEQLPLEELKAEFVVRAKHLAMAKQTPFGLDMGAVAIAATSLAEEEDAKIIGGLLGASQTKGDLGDWTAMGEPFKAIVAAQAKLRSKGCDAPYAVIMSPGKYAQLAGLMQHGRRELEMVGKLAGAGLLQSTSMPDDQVMVASPQPWNFDLVVGQDVATAYLGNDGLDHLFRIFETLVLRVKRPEAICVLS